MPLDDFLGRKGLASPISDTMNDKTKGIRQLRTTKGAEKFSKEVRASIDSYHVQRQQAIKEYNNLVSQSKIQPKTSLDKTLEKARGHEDNPSTQAARRMLTKRGIDWKTGKTIKINK